MVLFFEHILLKGYVIIFQEKTARVKHFYYLFKVIKAQCIAKNRLYILSDDFLKDMLLKFNSSFLLHKTFGVDILILQQSVKILLKSKHICFNSINFPSPLGCEYE